MNSKWNVWVILLALVATMFVASCGAGVTPQATTAPPTVAAKTEAPTSAPKPTDVPAKPIKVGMMAAITGPGAAGGRPLRAPVDIAVADYNRTAKVPVEVVLEDCGADNASAVNGLNRLLETKPVALLNFCGSPQFNAMSPILDKEGLPTTLFGTVPSLYERGYKWLFGPLPLNTVEASAGLKYLKEELSKKRVALFVPNDDSGKSVEQALAPTAKSLGLDIVATYFQYGDKDFSGNIAAARRSNPDAYMLIGPVNDTAILLRQIRQAGIQETVMGHLWANNAFLSLMEPSEIEGAYTWASSLPEMSTDPKVQAFGKALKDKANQNLDWIATTGYDTAMIVFTAIGKAGEDRAKIIDALHATQGYQGLSGEYNFDAKGRGRFETNLVKIGPNKQIIVLKTVKVKLD